MASRSMSIYEPQMMVPTATMPGLTSGSVAGEALKQGARVLAVVDTQLREEGKAWAVKTLTGLRDEYAQRLFDAEKSGNAGEGFVDAMGEEFTKRVEALRKEMPPYGQAVFEAGVQDMFNGLGARSREIEDATRAAQTSANVDEATDNLAAAARRDPQNIKSYIQEGRAIATAFNPPPEKRVLLEAKLRNILTSGVAGLAERDPAQALRLFESGEIEEYLPDPKVRAVLRARVDAEMRRRDGKAAADKGSAAVHAAIDAWRTTDAVAKGHKSFIDLPDAKALEGVIGRERARQLRRRVDEVQGQAKQRAEDMDTVATLMMAGKKLDPNNPAHARGYNDLHDNHFVQDMKGLTPEEQRRRELDFIAAAGMVPDKVRREIDADLRSGDVGRMAAAMAFIDELESFISMSCG